MFFKIGKVVSKNKNYIIFESNYTGYIIYVADANKFEKNKGIRIYIYIHRNEFTKTYYGFQTFKERILFDDLLGIPGIGPKSAMSLLKQGASHLIQAIVSSDINFIKKTPYIGERTASMIIFELKHKYEKWKQKENGAHLPSEISSTLKTLGFKQEQIEYAIKNLKPSESIEDLIEEAIKIISRKNESKATNI